MARIVWTKPAFADVEMIGDFIAESSPLQAANAVERLLNAVSRLEKFPQSGHYVFDVPETPLRELYSGRYRILYSYTSVDDVCRIVAVANPHQNILALLDDRDFDFSE